MLASQRLLSLDDAEAIVNGAALPLLFRTPEMNLASLGATATFDMPTTPSGFAWMLLQNRAQPTARDGTITTGPILKVGSNGTHDNFLAAGAVLTAMNATPKNSWAQLFGTPALAMPDGSGGPLVVEVATAAVLGTATVFRCKHLWLMQLVSLAP